MAGNTKGLRLEDLPPDVLARMSEEERRLDARQRVERAWGTRLVGKVNGLDKWLRRRITAKTSVPGLWLITTGMLMVWITVKAIQVFSWSLGKGIWLILALKHFRERKAENQWRKQEERLMYREELERERRRTARARRTGQVPFRVRSK